MGNPEELHDTAKNIGTKIMGKPGFVNPGTPASALVSEKDLPDATVSEKATNDLRSGLIK